jgi:hypothetical protein
MSRLSGAGRPDDAMTKDTDHGDQVRFEAHAVRSRKGGFFAYPASAGLV